VGRRGPCAAASPAVGAALRGRQRELAGDPPYVETRAAAGAVLDGRDIGTVVCPDATVKLYVTASAETRAQRRLKELRQDGAAAIYDDVLQDMKERDARDSERRVAPLSVATDAVTLDTTLLDPDQVFEQASRLIARQLAARR